VTHSETGPDFEQMLHPEELRSVLLSVSLFVMIFEMFRDRVVDHPRFLHSNEFGPNGWVVDKAAYERDVTSRHKNTLQASLLWFHSYNAIDDDDLKTFARIRSCRNRVVHELSNLLGSAAINEVGPRFQELHKLFRKIEVWWFRNFEMEFNDALAGREFEDDEITPGSFLMIQMLVDSALGEGDKAWRWYNAFAAARAEQPPLDESSREP